MRLFKESTITEYGPVAKTIGISYEDYEALDLDEKWMGNITLPAQAWFTRECQRIERLVYMPLPPALGHDEVTYFWRAEGRTEEAELLAHEWDDMDYNEEDDADFMPSDSSVDGEAEPDDDSESESSEDEDQEIPIQEVEGLLEEAASLPQPSGPAPLSTAPTRSLLPSVMSSLAQRPEVAVWVVVCRLLFSEGLISDRKTPMERKPKLTHFNLKRINKIYRRNGWPLSSFDRHQCKDQLVQCLEDWHARGRPRSEADAERDQQNMLAKHERRKKILEERAAAAETQQQ
ncbi:MAG: hypothetical protein Q9165_002512 [Trypethelium subeluteriae]